MTAAISVNQAPALPQSPRPIVLIGAGGIVRDAHLPAYAKAGFDVAGVYDLDKATVTTNHHHTGAPATGCAAGYSGRQPDALLHALLWPG